MAPTITLLRSVDVKLSPVVDYTTAGGTAMTIGGHSFGPAALAGSLTGVRLLYGDQWDTCIADVTLCMAYDGLSRDNAVVYTTPSGVGVNIPLAIYVGEQVSNVVFFSYSAPVITRLVVLENDPAVVTNIARLLITGINLGGSFC